MERHKDCPDKKCEPLNTLFMEDSFACIGKLVKPVDHGLLMGVNDFSWCMSSEDFSRWFINHADLISFVVLISGALRNRQIKLPRYILDILDWSEV